MSNDSKFWCPEIYRGLFVDRINDDKIKISPCCQAQPDIANLQDFDFRTNQYLSDLRFQFSQGNKPDACRACWRAELSGHKSRRQSAIEFYQIPMGDEKVILEGLDHAVTWACNLACVMCGPENSSTWASELDLGKDRLISMGRLFQKSNQFLDQIDISNLKKLHFNGGEPLLNNDHLSLLKKLESKNLLENVFISYNTNATQMPSKELLDLWARTKLIKLFFSIDATGIGFEYIRWPAKWEEAEHNMLKMKQDLPSNVMFGFNVAVGSYNLFEISDVKRWFDQNLSTNREGDLSDFNWQIVENFDPKFLKTDVKLAAATYLENTVEGLSAYLKSQINYSVSDTWIEKLSILDSRRGTSWKQSLKIGEYYQ